VGGNQRLRRAVVVHAVSSWLKIRRAQGYPIPVMWTILPLTRVRRSQTTTLFLNHYDETITALLVL
jgi:hypothetical protein